MSDEPALLAAIWEHPHDDAVRLAYADWLDENGQTERAEFIRVQIAFAALAGDDPRYESLERRINEIRAAREKAWWRAMPAGARLGNFSRGFPVPSLAKLSIPGLCRVGYARLKAAPLWRYHSGVSGEDLGPLLNWPFLHRLEFFALHEPVSPGWAERIADCGNLRNVSELSLTLLPVTAPEFSRILDAWVGRSLDTLEIDLDAAGAAVLGSHPVAQNLRTLRLGGQFGADGVRALTGGGRLTNLQRLSLDRHRIRDEGLLELLRWPGLPRLRALVVSNAGVTSAGVAALAACPAASNLRILWLTNNPIGPDAVDALVTSPHLRNLHRVALDGTAASLNAGAEAALRQRFGQGNY